MLLLFLNIYNLKKLKGVWYNTVTLVYLKVVRYCYKFYSKVANVLENNDVSITHWKCAFMKYEQLKGKI